MKKKKSPENEAYVPQAMTYSRSSCVNIVLGKLSAYRIKKDGKVV